MAKSVRGTHEAEFMQPNNHCLKPIQWDMRMLKELVRVRHMPERSANWTWAAAMGVRLTHKDAAREAVK